MDDKLYCCSDATNLIRKLSLVLDDIESFSYSKPKKQLTIKRKNQKSINFNSIGEFNNYLTNLKIQR